jgi:hypothetical protein
VTAPISPALEKVIHERLLQREQRRESVSSSIEGSLTATAISGLADEISRIEDCYFIRQTDGDSERISLICSHEIESKIKEIVDFFGIFSLYSSNGSITMTFDEGAGNSDPSLLLIGRGDFCEVVNKAG